MAAKEEKKSIWISYLIWRGWWVWGICGWVLCLLVRLQEAKSTSTVPHLPAF
jgi:hypothetical protein